MPNSLGTQPKEVDFMDTTADRRVQSVLVVLVAVSLVCSCSQTAMKVRQTSVAAPANILICAAIAPLRPTPGPSIPVDVVEFLWKTMEQDPEAGGFWTDGVAGGVNMSFTRDEQRKRETLAPGVLPSRSLTRGCCRRHRSSWATAALRMRGSRPGNPSRTRLTGTSKIGHARATLSLRF